MPLHLEALFLAALSLQVTAADEGLVEAYYEACLPPDHPVPAHCDVTDDRIALLQGKASAYRKNDGHASENLSAWDESWPAKRFRMAFSALEESGTFAKFLAVFHAQWLNIGCVIFLMALGLLLAQRLFPRSTPVKAISLGILYIAASACMIESNKWLMLPGHFPYPLMLTTNHMLMSLILANVVRLCCPWAFPALKEIEVTWWFCMKFIPIGAAFALSIVCGNGAYEYLSVSFLQIMKQCNIVTIYTFSVLCGLEALRRCSVILLLGTLCGTMMAVHGELHFQFAGFALQVVSSLSEAVKVIVQGILMSGTFRLDPLTMVLFMAPACLLANIIPLFALEGMRLTEIYVQFGVHLPVILLNASLAFILNVLVAQCIKMLSPVGYLLCGIVKDIAIIVTSSWFLGESLAMQQVVGFTMALTGVAAYSIYKQNQDCFQEDQLLPGFSKALERLYLPVPKTPDVKPMPRESPPDMKCEALPIASEK